MSLNDEIVVINNQFWNFGHDDQLEASQAVNIIQLLTRFFLNEMLPLILDDVAQGLLNIMLSHVSDQKYLFLEFQKKT